MADNINWTKVQSSNIDSIAYDEATKTAYVKFNNGSSHSYADVPKDLFEQFSSAESKGSFFNESIKNSFTASKL